MTECGLSFLHLGSLHSLRETPTFVRAFLFQSRGKVTLTTSLHLTDELISGSVFFCKKTRRFHDRLFNRGVWPVTGACNLPLLRGIFRTCFFSSRQSLKVQIDYRVGVWSQWELREITMNLRLSFSLYLTRVSFSILPRGLALAPRHLASHNSRVFRCRNGWRGSVIGEVLV